MKRLSKEIDLLLVKLKKIKLINKKKTIFLIGNTSKSNQKEYYFTPIREFDDLIIVGSIVYNEKKALQIAKKIDGKFDYIFVDSEKKIKKSNLHFGESANIERTVKENINKSKLLTYKGNDLTVEALDLFLSNLVLKELKGLGSKKISIIGVGNLGSKIALKLLERGAKVTIFRRNLLKLKTIAKALNIIKPESTDEKLLFTNDKYKAAKDSDILIGCTDGKPIIDKKMVEISKKNLIIIDVGKGTVKKEVLENKKYKHLQIYRLDITASLFGIINSNIYFHEVLKNNILTNTYGKYRVVSGGIYAFLNDIVVDNANKPTKVYGLSDGKGDIKTSYTKKEEKLLKSLSKKILNE